MSSKIWIETLHGKKVLTTQLIVLGKFIRWILLFGVFSCSRSTSKLEARLPEINETTRIILKPLNANPTSYDLTGNNEIVDAIKELKHGHFIIGRSIGAGSFNGTIEFDGVSFSIRASQLDTGGYRVILENELSGWWEGRELAKVLLERF